MALTSTTLSADLTASALTMTVGSTTGFPAVNSYNSRQLVLIDSEYMMVNYVPVSGTVKLLMRGYNGTSPAAHDTLANVVTSATVSDFPITAPGATETRPPYLDAIVSVGENGVIAVPIRNTTIFLSKASALSSTTLAAPSVAANGLRLTITSQTAAAHVITATALLGDAASGSPEDTATFDAFIGASLTLVASEGIWNVVAAVGVVIT